MEHCAAQVNAEKSANKKKEKLDQSILLGPVILSEIDLKGIGHRADKI